MHRHSPLDSARHLYHVYRRPVIRWLPVTAEKGGRAQRIAWLMVLVRIIQPVGHVTRLRISAYSCARSVPPYVLQTDGCNASPFAGPHNTSVGEDHIATVLALRGANVTCAVFFYSDG
jgi:hypothetical protein